MAGVVQPPPGVAGPPGAAVAVATGRRQRRPTGDPPPLPRSVSWTGLGWLGVAVVVAALTALVFGGGFRQKAVAVTVADDAVVRWLAGLQDRGLLPVLRGLGVIGSWTTIGLLEVGLILALAVLRRWRHLLVFVVAYNVAGLLAENVFTVQRPRPFGVPLRAGWGGWAMPSLPVAALATVLVSVLYTMVPHGRWRQLGKAIITGLLGLVALARISLGVDAPTDVLVGAVLGITLPLLMFRFFTPDEVFPVTYRRGRAAHLDVGGRRGVALREALSAQLGWEVAEITPFGLAASGGSTPLRIGVRGQPAVHYFGKLYAQSHLRADRWYKLGRELLYGRLEDEKPFNTVRRLVQQEDYALHLLKSAGLPTPAPIGIVELTPEREYLLVTEFFEGAVELGAAEVDDRVIDDGLSIVRRLWHAGLAHRDVKPANLLVRDGHVLLIDVAFAQVRPSPWRQAVDLANMMLCLALRSDPQRVYARALRQFTVADITEAFAAGRGLATPSQLRRLLRRGGRDLQAEFVRLLPAAPRPIRIQRWTARRVALLISAAVLAALVVGNATSLVNRDVVAEPLHTGFPACAQFESLWLEAQSVPTASMLPCVRPLPIGWTLTRPSVNDGRTEYVFDNDRAGPNALIVRLTPSCDTTGATTVAAATAGTQRYRRSGQVPTGFATTWYDTFAGGCLTAQLHSAAGPREVYESEAQLIIGTTSRDALRAALTQRSNGRLTLDPPPGR